MPTNAQLRPFCVDCNAPAEYTAAACTSGPATAYCEEHLKRLIALNRRTSYLLVYVGPLAQWIDQPTSFSVNARHCTHHDPF